MSSQIADTFRHKYAPSTDAVVPRTAGHNDGGGLCLELQDACKNTNPIASARQVFEASKTEYRATQLEGSFSAKKGRTKSRVPSPVGRPFERLETGVLGAVSALPYHPYEE